MRVWLKLSLILIASVISYWAWSNPAPVYLNKTFSKDGTAFVGVVNTSSQSLYCEITGINYYVDFFLPAQSASRWFLEPQGKYYWRCQ